MALLEIWRRQEFSLTTEMKMSAIEPRRKLGCYDSFVRSVVHLHDGRRIITCPGDGPLRLWDLESGAQIGDNWRYDGEAMVTIVLSPKGKTLAGGGSDGTVRVWDVETGIVIAKCSLYTCHVWSICWSTDGEHVVSGSSDGSVRMWDPIRDNILGPIKTGHGSVFAVIYSPDVTKIATGGVSGGIKIWDAKTCGLLSTIKHDRAVWRLAWTSDQKKLISGSHYDGSIRIFDAATLQQIAILAGHEDTINSISLSQNNSILASTSWDQTARLWNLDTNLPVCPPLWHKHFVFNAAISGDGKLLATACDDGNAYIWDVRAILKDTRLESLPSIAGSNAVRLTSQPEHPHRLPPGFFGSTRVVQFSQPSAMDITHRRHAPTFTFLTHPRRFRPHFSSLFHRTQPRHNTKKSMEFPQFHDVEVAPIRDSQSLYVAPRQETISDKAKRIKNPTLWTRCMLFICCVIIPRQGDQ